MIDQERFFYAFTMTAVRKSLMHSNLIAMKMFVLLTDQPYLTRSQSGLERLLPGIIANSGSF